MTDKKLFYTYTGKWSNNVLPTSLLYPDSLIFHKRSKRLIYNGDIYGSGLEGNSYFVDGESTDNVGVWTGTNENIMEYFEGLTIIYIPKVSPGEYTTTLNINNFGAKNCYINNDNITDRHYLPNVPILLTYTNGSWKHADYGSIGNIDSFTTKVYNKNNEDYTYNIVFSEKSDNNTYTFSYIDAEFNYNPLTNTLHVGKIDAMLNSLVANGSQSHISNNDRKVITNIGITQNKEIAYYYSDCIGTSYFDGNSYLGEIFSNYEYNIAYGTYGSSFGNHTVTYNESEAGFGSYNAYNENQIFSIGIGTSETNRKNALWIDINGSTYTNNVFPEENNTYNIGSPTKRYNTIYGKTFNGTTFTGKSAQVDVTLNSNIDPKFFVGFDTNTKNLYYENSLTFNTDGQIESKLQGNFNSPITNSPFIILSKRKVENLNVDYLDNYHANELLENSYIKTENGVSGATLTYYIKVGGKEIHGKQNLYNDRLSGNNSYYAWGQKYWENGIPKSINGNILPDTNNAYTLGNGTSYWGYSYLTNIITKSISFDGTTTIGSNVKFIYWKDGVATVSDANVGSDTEPIYLNNGSFTKCSYSLSVNVKEGTANRLAYYSGNKEISAGNIVSDGNYISTVSYLSINNNHQTTHRLYVDGTSMFKNTINIDSNAIGGANHINFNRANYNYINIPTGGTFAVSINGAGFANSKLAVNANAVYPGANNNIVDLGTSTSYWKDGYIKNIHTSSISFDGTTTIGSNVKFIYWKDGVVTASNANVGSDTEPIYLSNGSFVKCNNTLSVNVKEGTANKLAYYSGNKEISAGNIVSDGNYISNVSYLSINNNHQTTHRLYVNGTSMFKNTINIDSNTMGLANHINFNRAAFNCINVPTGGTFAVSVNGASGTNSKLAVDVNAVYPGQNNNTVDLGTTSYGWKTGYINNLITKSVSFDGTTTIGSNVRFIYWKDGVATATDTTLGNSTKPIYLNGGSFTECQSYADYEASTIISFTKSIKVLKAWGDTGIAGNNLETGTYVVQMIVGTNIYYSGVVSWYKDSTSSTETDEIVLHMAGSNPTERIYLKTTMVSSGSLKLQISGEKDWSAAANIVFKFKKLI